MIMIRTTLFKFALFAGLSITLALPADAQRRGREGEQELARLLEGLVEGRPVECIPLRASSSSRIIDRTAIVYDQGRTIYVNRPTAGAESLDRSDILVVRPTSGQFCRLDSVRLLDSVSRTQTGFVNLGQFVPYTRARR